MFFTLNKGIGLAKAEYIARMDADDISLPERFTKQFEHLQKNNSLSMVACPVDFIDEHDNTVGEWEEDLNCVLHSEIKSMMVQQNCIAHPSVMIKTEVAKKYQYNPHQKHCEDYDLWLRIIADDHVIEKVPEKLLLYRVLDTSITGSILRKSNPFFRQLQCKRKFLAERIKHGKWGVFESKVLFAAISDGISGSGKEIKKAVKG